MKTGRRGLLAAILIAPAIGTGALAQGYSPNAPQSASPVCTRLEGQLTLINRGGDPGQSEQVRRYEEALSRQHAELDRLVAQQRRMGCESMGIFSLFVSQPAECRPLNAQVQEARNNANRTQMELQRLQGGDMESQRQAVIAALAQNNCGPQYQAAANQQRGFFGGLFGGGSFMPAPDGYSSSTYRTLCVRTCDGYYFPISFQASPTRFPEDEQTCQRLCPASEVTLYTHRNPGEDIGQAVSIAGRAYRDLPTAFRYRQALDSACSCRKPGQSWADALGVGRDTTVERGDIIVTEERSRAMAQPRTDAQGRPIRADARAPQGAAGATAAQPGATAQPARADASATPGASAKADADIPSGPVRTVGPPFVPAR